MADPIARAPKGHRSPAAVRADPDAGAARSTGRGARAMLSVSGLETYYGQSQVLFGMELEVGEGEVVTLMGRNGMGKTTTIHSIMGITPSRGGEIFFDGQPIHGLAPHQIAKAGVGLVPEGRQIFPNLTTRENLIAAPPNRKRGSRPWTVDRVFAMFPAIKERVNNMGELLSGGEQQMLAIGRALMTNPRLLILDEATEGLAPLVRKDIWRSLEELKREGLSILIVDKNIADLTRIADRHYVIEKGVVVWQGASAALSRNKTVQHQYLGV